MSAWRAQRSVGGRALQALMALAIVTTLGAASAGCKKGSSSGNDGGDGSMITVSEGGTDGRTDGRDTGVDMFVCPPVDAPKAVGATCACDAECGSNYCVDGVCCTPPAPKAARPARPPARLGTCVMRSSGDAPRDSTTCTTTPRADLRVRRHVRRRGRLPQVRRRTRCARPGTCDGDAVVGVVRLRRRRPLQARPDAHLRRRSRATDARAPASTTCTQPAASASSGQQCVSGSCGKRMKGATCEANDDCASGFCADGVCCNVACEGALPLAAP